MMALADGDSGDSRRWWWRLQVVVALTGGGGTDRWWCWQTAIMALAGGGDGRSSDDSKIGLNVRMEAAGFRKRKRWRRRRLWPSMWQSWWL